MFRSLSDHQQGLVLLLITGQDRTQHTHCNRHAATSITLVTEVKTNIVPP